MKRRTASPAKRVADEPIANRGVYGEGNYQATRAYNEATRRFVRSGKVAQAARKAAPRDASEAAMLERAEREGKSRSKGEDPALRSGRGAESGRKPAKRLR